MADGRKVTGEEGKSVLVHLLVFLRNTRTRENENTWTHKKNPALIFSVPGFFKSFPAISSSKGGAQIQPSFDDGIQIHGVSEYLHQIYR